ncbi:hypothetical protein F5050DRAFT_449471 [Lentinula boryana]|uniref:Altered inheritance of mitochondria protein 6 n=1 Tax=Lentinula boryana TaxID=40481 RepID=A0ABQ8Q800_9AGAR|nr:hypothetical protein F5050DRAFT_449471 [Lentinula boryana]
MRFSTQTSVTVIIGFVLMHGAGFGLGVLGRPTVFNQITMLEESNSTLLQYPTQFTQNIVPKQIHSHNDYWRDVPLLSALSLGVASVEADVWFINETLFVGHELAALTPSRTFDSLYIQPLLNILARQNPANAFTANQTTPNGVFDTSSSTPLQLLIDMKTDGNSTLPPVLKSLEPLRQLKYLTTYTNDTLTISAITAIGTGNTPLEGIKSLSPRDVFFDAPLTQLNDPSTTYNSTLSPIASTDYASAIGWDGIGNISETQLGNVERFIGDAHIRGIKARFWDTPGWPVRARDGVWEMLMNSGADWLNADDLEAASGF